MVVRIDFDTEYVKCEKIIETLHQMEERISRLNTVVESLDENWQGEGNKDFNERFKAVIQRFEELKSAELSDCKIYKDYLDEVHGLETGAI